MRRFEITEIANGWLLSYHTDTGYVQRFFTNVHEITEILQMVITKDNQLKNRVIG